MEKRMLWMCLAVGSMLGGLVPEAWGASGIGVASIVGSVIGAIVGVGQQRGSAHVGGLVAARAP